MALDWPVGPCCCANTPQKGLSRLIATSLCTNELVIIREWGCTGLHGDDLSVFESHEGHDGFRVGVVCEVNN
jgi:hypothetical protein